MSKLTGRVVAESLRRADGNPSMPDEDFNLIVQQWIQSIPAHTEPYTLTDLHKALKQLEAGVFAIMPHIDKPFPDDPRWTPYTRFIEQRLQFLDLIVKDLIVRGAAS